MFQPIYPFCDLEIDPTDVREVLEIVFNDELAGDILKFNTHVFWAVKWGAEVEVFKVEAGRLC